MSDDFDDLERQLRERPVSSDEQADAVALKGRVLNAMHAARPRESARRRAATSLWLFAAGAAAAVVLLSNVAISSIQSQSYFVQSRGTDGSAALAFAAELRDLAPELDAREALRQALLLQARGRTHSINTTWLRQGTFTTALGRSSLE